MREKNNAETSSRFAAALRNHASDLYKTAYRLTGNQADAEDLTQELFAKLFELFEQWRDLPEPKAWMRRVLFNLHVDHYRKRNRTHGINPKTLDPQENIFDSLSCDSATPEVTLHSARSQIEIRRALDSLDVDQRTLVVLHLIEGFSLEQVGTIMDVPVGTLKSRLHRCKTKLKATLKKVEPFFENERLPS